MRLQHNVCTSGKVDSYTFEGKNINYIIKFVILRARAIKLLRSGGCIV